MKRISSVVAMHMKNHLLWIMVPWAFSLIPSFSINVMVAYFVDTPMYTGALVSIYIGMFIVGTMIIGDTFPFALGFGMRRTDYFLGTMIMLIASSAAVAILLLLLSLVETRLTNGWGVTLHFFNLPYLNDGSLIEQLWVYFGVLVHVYLLGFVLSSLYFRFGSVSMYIFFPTAALFISLVAFFLTYSRLWEATFSGLAQYSAFEITLWLSLVSIGYALLSFVFLRKATL